MRKLLATAAAALVTAGLITGLPTSAQAASRYIGTNAQESRCSTSGRSFCYYYSTWSQAWWGTYGLNDMDLGGNRYATGSGAGSGQVVRNNARKFQCASDGLQCISYYSPYLGGNADWLYGGQRGELYYTWNDNASAEFV